MADRFQRLNLIFNETEIKKLKTATIVICGVGAVGSSCIYTLARCGIYNFILIDFDVVDITNINRQFVAFESTLNKEKTSVMKSIILDINPNAKVTILNEKLDLNNIDDILSNYNIDYLVDAVDDVNAKCGLIRYCLNKNIKIISSMGAALKTDITKIKIGSLNSATNCSLAKSVRYKLKEKNILYNDLKCVYSTEIPDNKIRDNFKTEHMLPSYMPITETFGIYMADYIIKGITQ